MVLSNRNSAQRQDRTLEWINMFRIPTLAYILSGCRNKCGTSVCTSTLCLSVCLSLSVKLREVSNLRIVSLSCLFILLIVHVLWPPNNLPLLNARSTFSREIIGHALNWVHGMCPTDDTKCSRELTTCLPWEYAKTKWIPLGPIHSSQVG